MKHSSMLGLMIAATAISELFNRATFAARRRMPDPFARRHRHHGAFEPAYCRQCERVVSKKRHRCVAPYVAAPRHGWRYEQGKLVRRTQR
ncbi:MAG TPA: hypothetical protein VJ833_09920 [Rhodanobacteraceae bacterium]|nr:hypothetical protein [Rhodanobacteraceae bacterium]